MRVAVGAILCVFSRELRQVSDTLVIRQAGRTADLQSATTAKSWVGPGQNQPIDPGQLRSALGQKTVSEVAQQAGINEQELLSQLSQNLPQLVDQLTPNGRVPSLQEIAAALTRK